MDEQAPPYNNHHYFPLFVQVGLAGVGRAWPLLTGERGHYEIAAGRDPAPYIRAMEHFASSGGLLPEQVWDEADKADAHMYFGKATGSAMPLMWAHAEYIKLLRSRRDRRVFDLIPEVVNRYIVNRSQCNKLEIWKLNRQVSSVESGHTLRVLCTRRFLLHWSDDDWRTTNDTQSVATSLGAHFVDVNPSATSLSVRFTFFWIDEHKWEGQDHKVSVVRDI